MTFKGAIVLSEKDNVATCVQDVESGTCIGVRYGEKMQNVTAQEDIPFGFKIAVKDIAKGEHIKKYGESIGLASSNIATGDMVHVHNLEGTRGRGGLVAGGQQ